MSAGTLVPFAGLAWRGHDPRWAHEPTSGAGAAITRGRFNRRGEPTLYLALSEETAIREVQAGFVDRFQPMTLCAYTVEDALVADLRNGALLRSLGFSSDAPACDWRLAVDDGREPPSWGLADALRAAGAHGLLTPSFATGARAGDLNLVLWSWNTGEGPARVAVIDDFRRLPQRSTH